MWDFPKHIKDYLRFFVLQYVTMWHKTKIVPFNSIYNKENTKFDLIPTSMESILHSTIVSVIRQISRGFCSMFHAHKVFTTSQRCYENITFIGLEAFAGIKHYSSVKDFVEMISAQRSDNLKIPVKSSSIYWLMLRRFVAWF